MSDNDFYFLDSDYYDSIPVEHWYDGFYDDSESSYDYYYDDYSSEWGYYGDDTSSSDDDSLFDDDNQDDDEYSFEYSESDIIGIKEDWPTYNMRYLPSYYNYNEMSVIQYGYDEFNFHESDFPQLSTSNTNVPSQIMEILTNPPIVEHLTQYLDSNTLALTCNTFLPLYSDWQYYRPSFDFKIPGPIQRNRVASFSIRWNPNELDHFINISVSAA